MQLYCTPKICPLPSRLATAILRPHSWPDEILKSGANYYGFDEKSLMGKSRKRALCEARFCIMYALRSYTPLTLAQVGILFNRDHTSVIYSVKTVNELIGIDAKFRECYNGFLDELKRLGITGF